MDSLVRLWPKRLCIFSYKNFLSLNEYLYGVKLIRILTVKLIVHLSVSMIPNLYHFRKKIELCLVAVLSSYRLILSRSPFN